MCKDGSMCVSLQAGYVPCVHVFKVGSVYVWGVSNNVNIISKYTKCDVSINTVINTVFFAEETSYIN